MVTIQLLFTIPAFVAFILTFGTLFFKKRIQLPQLTCLVALLVMGICIAAYGAHYNAELTEEYAMSWIFVTTGVLSGPVFLFSLCSRMAPKGVTNKLRRIFLPIIIFFVLYWGTIIVCGVDVYKSYMERGVYGNDYSLTGDPQYDWVVVMAFWVYASLLFISLMLALAQAVYISIKFSKIQKEFTAKTGIKQQPHKWLNIIVSLMVVVSFLVMFASPLNKMVEVKQAIFPVIGITIGFIYYSIIFNSNSYTAKEMIEMMN